MFIKTLSTRFTSCYVYVTFSRLFYLRIFELHLKCVPILFTAKNCTINVADDEDYDDDKY